MQTRMQAKCQLGEEVEHVHAVKLPRHGSPVLVRSQNPARASMKASTLTGQGMILREQQPLRSHDVHCKAFHSIRSEQRI